MKKKFVQIVSFFLIPAMAALLAAEAVLLPGAAAGSAGQDARVIRIGIYYGSTGKGAVSLSLNTGDGFEFGTYSSSGAFTPLSGVAKAAARSVTVQTDSASRYGILVRDASGKELLRYDDRGQGSGLAIRPYSSQGQKTVTKCGYPYYGGFRFERFSSYNDRMTVVNYLTLSDYLKGVVPYEASASWPIESLKAQAVCARTYALSRIDASHQKNYRFDLCDNVHCQSYKGVYTGSQASKISEAVDGTNGVTVRYNGAYCETLYSSSNGGASESNINVNGKDLPYLVGKEDPFEALIADIIPNYNWTKTFTGTELQTKLIADGYTGCGRITGLKTTLSAAGNVIALTFTDEYKKSYTIYRDRCRTFLTLRSLRYTVSSENGSKVISSGNGNGTSSGSTIGTTVGTSAGTSAGSGYVDSGGNSLDFSKGVLVVDGNGTVSTVTGGYVVTANGVEEIGTAASPVPSVTPPAVTPPTGTSSMGATSATGTVFTFKGTGWGHNVGLSQYGAYSMAQLGYNYKEILEFYYTGVTVN